MKWLLHNIENTDTDSQNCFYNIIKYLILYNFGMLALRVALPLKLAIALLLVATYISLE